MTLQSIRSEYNIFYINIFEFNNWIEILLNIKRFRIKYLYLRKILVWRVLC